jgi:hypothetical protein
MAARRRRTTEKLRQSGSRRKRLRIEALEVRCLLSAQPVINEFLASNTGVFQDEDGDFSDFLELTNRGDEPVNLAGWYLTDNASDLTKWQIPSVNLPPGQFLVVFASNKDRATAGNQLHTNFALAAEGEYLALVQPDGETVASAFTPQFPPQYEDVSYGIAASSAETKLIELGSGAQVLIPSSESLGTTWVNPGFVPNPPWQTGPLAIGYGASQVPPPSTTVLQVDFNDRNNTGNTQPGFSSFAINGTTNIQTAPVTRSFGGINVTLTDVSGAGYDDRSRSTPTNSGTFSDAQLLQDFVFSTTNTGTGGLDVSIDGLVAGATYTLTVWSYDSGSTGQRTSDWTANGVTVEDYGFDGAATPTSNDTYKFGFVVAANSQGRIVLQGRKDESTNNFAVFLNALRLETGDTLNPPPTAANVLRVDFNDRTEGEAGAANTEQGYSTMTLDESPAVFDEIEVTISPYGATTLDDRDRTGPVDAGSFSLDQVYDDVIYAVNGAAGTGMEILVEGLVPNATYDLLLRSYDFGASGARQSIWTEESSGQSVVIASPYSFDGNVVPASNNDYAMRASLVTSAQGTLLLRGVQVGADRSVMVNALELTRSGFGELVGTDVKSSMMNANSSAFIRVPFSVPSLAAVDQLLLDMQYDAGFVAYLNGQEVARRNAPTAAGVPPAFNAVATTERSNSEALAAETIDLTQFKHLLSQGSNNVLAIHGLNSAAGDEDFLIAPQLRAISVGGSALRYFETPTPGAVNTSGVIDFVSAVQSSAGHGFYDAPFSVTLTTPTSGTSIYYTFDGSVPAPGNPKAMLYTAPFIVDTTTVLRSAAVREGWADSPVTTATYLFLGDVLGQTINPSNPASNPFGLAYPATWQANAAGDYNIDPEVVAQWDDNNPANQDFGIREALLSLPTMSIVMPHNDLWSASTGIYPNSTSQGDAWRRAGSIEYINPETGEQFQYNVGVQMHGAASRDNVRLKKHSFRLVFNPEFDGPGRLRFPLFEDSDFADINTVVMKAAFTDSFATRTISGRYTPITASYMRDVSMLDAQRAMGSLAPHATYVHLYINGLYWGLYYPAERTDDAYLASHIGGNQEDWDIVKDFNELFRGNKDAWNAMFALVNQLPGKTDAQADAIYQQLQGRNPDGTLNPALPVYLDMDNLIDYTISHLYAGVEDWPSHNWVAARNRVNPGAGFQFFTWDQEIAWDGRFRDRTDNQAGYQVDIPNTPGQLYLFLRRESPEFRLRFADRVQKHMFNDGALTIANTQERWQARADQIEAAIIGESARWGDAREGEVVNVPPTTTVPLLTVNHWRDSVADVHDQYIPQSHPLTMTRFTADGLFPTVGAPQFSQFGGEVAEGFSLAMSTTSGGATIWYTTNGQDPRLLGGAVNTGSATAYSGGVLIDGNTTIKARTRVGSTWSALTEATFVVSPENGGVVITEINYHPYDVTAEEEAAIPGVAEDSFEFIEIHNTHPTKSINLANMSLAGGLSFTFGNVSLGPGQFALVVEDAAAFMTRYGAGHNILGTWSGGLNNAGDTVELRNALGGLMMATTYADAAPWSQAADGDGPTLELFNPAGNGGDAANWRASFYDGGSPGGARESLPGDYNRDRVVDAADHVAWRANFGRSVEVELSADGNGDGAVDAADYAVWRNNQGATSTGGGAALTQTVSAENVSDAAQPQNGVALAIKDSAFGLLGSTRPLPTADSTPPHFRRMGGSTEFEAERLLGARATGSPRWRQNVDSLPTVDRCVAEFQSTGEPIDRDELNSMLGWNDAAASELLDRALEMLISK